ncbi:MAG: 2Fe-2S iron-sulfur cluster-binding protein [Sedimenticola sp.]|nr:2Fe-2S iron-sulfur cluster-binding protein [Sedimenticola sp.]
MNTGSLALIIAALLFAQTAAMLLSGYYRHWRQHKHRLQSGNTSAATARTTLPTTSREKKAAGWSGFREFEVKHRVIEDTDGQICSFYLVPMDGKPLPAFQPGQFLTFRLSTDNEPLTRCYSLSDRPRPDYYRVTIKRVLSPSNETGLPPGRSSNYFHDQITQGSRLQIKAPAGQFHLDQESDRPLVLIGGGIGITPMLSMLEHLLVIGSEREIWLFYGARNSREAIMSQRLRTLEQQHPNFHLHLCFSQPLEGDLEGGNYQHHGRVDIDLLRKTLPLAGYPFYLCGPPAMMQSLVPGLEALGIDPANIHYEAFGPASLPGRQSATPDLPPENATAHQVYFSRSGRQITWQPGGGSLLELAETEGIEVDSGCRAGGCGACQTRLESGEVHYESPPDADIASGHCLLCTTTPKSNLVLQL